MPASANVKKSKKPLSDATKSELTRQRILDSAARVFAQRGYAHTRLIDVAREAQSHAGGIYYYFASREALVEELLSISTQRSVSLVREALQALRSDATTFEKLRTAITAQLTSLLAGDSYNIAFNKIYPQVPETILDRHRTILREYFEIWRDIIRQGQAQGEIRADVDAAVMRLTIVGSIQWAVEWARPQNSSAEILGEQMANVFFSGIKAEK
ncbi:TetR/AcrR family transcriptional regulator [Novosphingobium sp. G106]|uniref:TetR/AcrR family transcriptional regulator n=1 Tax=Novosphingobium sp. G106 TaxID=2849500 RepID=UPI001C2CDBE2|nr:TetR/AcrR family transcriptional regulator [Novosphingobium sp. G106]MBV1688961.1 TetR/AcrR family transcriptional regulator [Novosphingobium sp. G106]